MRVPNRWLPAVAGLLLAACVVACGGSGGAVSVPASPAGTAQAVKPPAKASDELQAERDKLITEFQRKGYVKKIDGGPGTPRLWVTPKFMLLDYDVKKDFAMVAYAYAFELPKETKSSDVPIGRMLAIYHTKSGKRIGTYHPQMGLDLD